MWQDISRPLLKGFLSDKNLNIAMDYCVKWQKACVSWRKANGNMNVHGYACTFLVSGSQSDLAFLCMCHPMPAGAAA